MLTRTGDRGTHTIHSGLYRVTVRRLFDYRLHTGMFNYATNLSATLEVQQLGVAGSERYAVQRLLQVGRLSLRRYRCGAAAVG